MVRGLWFVLHSAIRNPHSAIPRSRRPVSHKGQSAACLDCGLGLTTRWLRLALHVSPHSAFPLSFSLFHTSSFIIRSWPSVCAKFGFVWRYTFRPTSSCFHTHHTAIPLGAHHDRRGLNPRSLLARRAIELGYVVDGLTVWERPDRLFSCPGRRDCACVSPESKRIALLVSNSRFQLKGDHRLSPPA